MEKPPRTKTTATRPVTSTDKPTRTALDREAWVRGAISVLASEGADGLRVETLAKHLGVTKGSFYWHFKDRRDLLDGVLATWREGRIRDIRKQTTARPGAEVEALLHTIDVYSAARNRKGIHIELAVRDWARRDPAAAAALEAVDGERLACTRRLFLASGLSAEEAQARSVLLYAYVFGVSLLHHGSQPLQAPSIEAVNAWIAAHIARARPASQAEG